VSCCNPSRDFRLSPPKLLSPGMSLLPSTPHFLAGAVLPLLPVPVTPLFVFFHPFRSFSAPGNLRSASTSSHVSTSFWVRSLPLGFTILTVHGLIPDPMISGFCQRSPPRSPHEVDLSVTLGFCCLCVFRSCSTFAFSFCKGYQRPITL